MCQRGGVTVTVHLVTPSPTLVKKHTLTLNAYYFDTKKPPHKRTTAPKKSCGRLYGSYTVAAKGAAIDARAKAEAAAAAEAARMPIAAEEARRGASGGNAMAVVMAAARTKAMVARA